MPSAFYLSAAHKSSGKTVITLGLARIFKDRCRTQIFKKGPDYIDPLWLAKASGRPCFNLDFYTMSNAEIKAFYQHHSKTADVVFVEGNKGLYDGVTTKGGDANADLATLLNMPVILVIDTTGMTRGVAPLVLGYQAFSGAPSIFGVILNKVAGTRHESKLVGALEYYTDTPVIGAVYRNNDLKIGERHLGLVPANELDGSENVVERIAKRIDAEVDTEKLTPAPRPSNFETPPEIIEKTLCVAVARGSAFGFYYPDDLQMFENLGVRLIFFDPETATSLPAADGLFIGGGFPEMHLSALSQNHSLLADIRQKIVAGLPAYAECGGLMYLSKNITADGAVFAMAGVVDASAKMASVPVGRGYVTLKATRDHPWFAAETEIAAHEFHYSYLENINEKTRYGYEVSRGEGIGGKDGILVHRLLASYSHIRSVGGNLWVARFVEFIRKNKN